MSEKNPPEQVTPFRERHFNETMNRLGERRLAQGIQPNMKHLYEETKDVTEMETDPITGLLNRNSYERAEKDIIKLANRLGLKLIFIRFDVNGLKPINDTDGHSAGDKVLEDTGITIAEALRETDIGGRVGGDEFKVTLVDADLEGAKGIWNTRLLPKFNEKGVKISAGAAEVDVSSEENVKESDDLADDAQSKAKIASRTSNASEFRTTEDLTQEDIINREQLRKAAERKTAA